MGWAEGNTEGTSPGVPVLVSDLLLHLCVGQGLQQGAPLVSVARVADGDFHCGQGVLAAEEITSWPQPVRDAVGMEAPPPSRRIMKREAWGVISKGK